MDELKNLRKQKGLTQKELADRLGIAQATISAWETGVNKPDMDSIIKLCTVFQTSIDDLLDSQSFIDHQKPETIEEATSASKMLSGFINFFQTIPPDKLQEFFRLAQIVLPQAKTIIDTDGQPIVEDLTPIIDRLNSGEVIPWLIQEPPPEPPKEAESPEA